MRALSFLARPLTLLSSTITHTSFRTPSSLTLPRRTFVLSLGLATWSSSSHSSSALWHDIAASSSASCENMETGYLNATAAAALDAELMTQPGFTLEQLMELAGLSVAQAVFTVVEEEQQQRKKTGLSQPQQPHILVICGPGNNGGDGLVAARHLVHFGYKSTLVYPKRSSKQPHYGNLVQQCLDLGIEIRDDLPDDLLVAETGGNGGKEESIAAPKYAAIVDAMFGFSFVGTPREPFASILDTLVKIQDTTTIVAVDVPSGWHVSDGDVSKTGFAPSVLVSLTAPKNCARFFTGKHHFCGGRFVPPALAEKYDIRMPPYPGFSQVMELPRGGASGNTDTGWEEGYAAYLAEKETKEFAGYKGAAPDVNKPNDNDKEASWEEQYASHLAEKERKEFADYEKKE